NKMFNAIKIAADIIYALPKLTLSPETTEGFEGFIHPNKLSGQLENARIDFILRDFDTNKLTEYRNLIDRVCAEVIEKYPGSSYTIEVKNQYRNMKDVLERHPHVAKTAIKAMENLGIPVDNGAIR